MSETTVQRALPPGSPGCHIHMEDLLIGTEELSADYRPSRTTTMPSGYEIRIPESVTLDLGALRLVLSPEAWDQVIEAVRAAIAEGRKQAVAEQVQADMADNPIIAGSPVLAGYLAAEGIEVTE